MPGDVGADARFAIDAVGGSHVVGLVDLESRCHVAVVVLVGTRVRGSRDVRFLVRVNGEVAGGIGAGGVAQLLQRGGLLLGLRSVDGDRGARRHQVRDERAVGSVDHVIGIGAHIAARADVHLEEAAPGVNPSTSREALNVPSELL